MAYQTLLRRTLVFDGSALGIPPSELELSKISGHIVVVRRKGKTDEVTPYDLQRSQPLQTITAKGADVSNTLVSPDGNLYGFIKINTWSSVFKTVDLRTGEPGRSVNYDFRPTTSFIWPNKDIIIYADPYKRVLASWTIGDPAHQRCQSLIGFPTPFPDGTVSRYVTSVATPDAKYLGMVDWVQWPALKKLNPHFWAGFVRVFDNEKGPSTYKDFWAQAVAFVDVATKDGRVARLMCYANRMSPAEGMVLNITELEPDPYERPYDKRNIPIPTHDPFDVPRHIHIAPQSNTLLVVTNSGSVHAYDFVSGQYRDRMMLDPKKGVATAQYSSADGGNVMYVRTDLEVHRIDVG